MSIKRVLIVEAHTKSARLTSRSSSGNSVYESWEVFDAPAFATYLRELAIEVEKAEASGNATPMDTAER